MEVMDKIAVGFTFSSILGSSFCIVWIVIVSVICKKINPKTACAGLKWILVLMYLPIDYLIVCLLPQSNSNGKIVSFVPKITSVISFRYEGLAIAWIAGMMFLLLWHLFSIHLLRSKLRVRLPLPKNQREIFERVKEELKIKKDIGAYTSYVIGSPFIVGIRKPAVYLPVDEYSDRELEIIFTHELYHYLHHDAIWRKIITISHILFWYNPLFYIIYFYSDRWIESNCDFKCFEHFDKKEYFNTILNLQTSGRLNKNICSMLKGKNSQLRQRVRIAKRCTQNEIDKKVIAFYVASIVVFGLICNYRLTMLMNNRYTREFLETIDEVDVTYDLKIGNDNNVLELENINDEYKSSVDDILWDIEYEEIKVQESDSYYSFANIEIKPDSAIYLKDIKMSTGSTLSLAIGVEPNDCDLIVGFVKFDEVDCFMEANIIDHDFYIDESGYYGVILKNIGNDTVYVIGSYIVK